MIGFGMMFGDGNPIVGYGKLKACVRLLFWSGQSFAEQLGLVFEFFVRQCDHLVFERLDLCDDFHRLFDITVVGRTEDGLGDSAEHGQTSEIYG